VSIPFAKDEIAILDAACPIEIMKFTLTYDGELRSSGNSPKPKDKWIIRRKLHPQLAELWKTHAVLARLSSVGIWVHTLGNVKIEQHHSIPDYSPRFEQLSMSGWKNLIEPMPVADCYFIPLIKESLSLVCELDILFLRKEEPGSLVKQGGDIDNRIKTLFDGLRMPNKEEMEFCGSDPIPLPFYCLLEEDTLITAVNIRTGRLLTQPDSNQFEVRLVIDVTVKAIHVRSYNLPLLGD